MNPEPLMESIAADERMLAEKKSLLELVLRHTSLADETLAATARLDQLRAEVRDLDSRRATLSSIEHADLLLAAECATVFSPSGALPASLATKQKSEANYLRSRGWKQPDTLSWRDPQGAATMAMQSALTIQFARDLSPVRERLVASMSERAHAAIFGAKHPA